MKFLCNEYTELGYSSLVDLNGGFSGWFGKENIYEYIKSIGCEIGVSGSGNCNGSYYDSSYYYDNEVGNIYPVTISIGGAGSCNGSISYPGANACVSDLNVFGNKR